MREGYYQPSQIEVLAFRLEALDHSGPEGAAEIGEIFNTRYANGVIPDCGIARIIDLLGPLARDRAMRVILQEEMPGYLQLYLPTSEPKLPS